MDHKLDAVVKRHNKKIYVALSHPPCNTVLEIGKFPETCPFGVWKSWVERKTDTLPLWHKCAALRDTRVATLHSPADPSLFGGAAVLRYARECVAGVRLVVNRIAAVWQRKGATRQLLATPRR